MLFFCSNLFVEEEKVIKNSKNPPSMSIHRFQKSIIRGFEKNNFAFNIINAPLMRAFPNYSVKKKKKTYTVQNGHEVINVGFCNLPGLNYITKTVSLYLELKGIAENLYQKTTFLLYNSYLPQSIAILLLKKKYKNVVSCNIVADIHGNYGLKTYSKGLKGFLTKQVGEIEDYFGKKHDSFVFLTEEMNKVFNKNHKPYIVMEGIYTENNSDDIRIADENIILYAGTLRLDYGIKHLLDAFSLIKDPSYKLYLAGGGDMVDTIMKYQKNDDRIKYLGYLSQDELLNVQQKAKVFVNPRENKEAFVKYSFPSKTMECLASGKPLISHKLSCYGTEYQNYIDFAEDDSALSLAKKIVEVCERTDNELLERGKVSRKFILNEKCEKNQVKKISSIFQGDLRH